MAGEKDAASLSGSAGSTASGRKVAPSAPPEIDAEVEDIAVDEDGVELVRAQAVPAAGS